VQKKRIQETESNRQNYGKGYCAVRKERVDIFVVFIYLVVQMDNLNI
jgi:hypothetical protein